MKAARRTVVGTLLALVCTLVQATPPTEPLVLHGVKASYKPGDLLDIRVENKSAESLSINVALEGYENGKWMQQQPTIGVKPGERPSMIARTTMIRPGEAVSCTFDMWGEPIQRADRPTRLRLRADSYSHGKRLSPVVSSEFTIPGDRHQ